MASEQNVSSMPDDVIVEVAENVGRQWGMSGSELLQHLAIGDVPHAAAPPEECGMSDPRDDAKWCRRFPGHSGNHNWYTVGE